MNEKIYEETEEQLLQTPGKTAKVSPGLLSNEEPDLSQEYYESRFSNRRLQKKYSGGETKAASKISFSKLVERLVLYSLGDSFATEEIHETLKGKFNF